MKDQLKMKDQITLVCSNKNCNWVGYTNPGQLIPSKCQICKKGEIVPIDNHIQKEEKNPNPLKTQIGGNHYKNFKIQPVEFITKNNLNFLEGCIIKRICRRKDKERIQDLEKAKHEIDMLIKFEGEKTNE